MKFQRVTGVAIGFLLLFGPTISVYAQRDGQGDNQEKQGKQDKGARQQQRAQQPEEQRHDQPQRAPQQPQRAGQPQQERQQQQRAQQPQQQQEQQPQRDRQPQQQQRVQQQQQPPVQEQPQPPQRARQYEQQQPIQQQQQQRIQQQPQRQQQQRAQQTQRTQQEARSWQQQRGWLHQGGWQGRDSFLQNRSQHWSSDHRTWTQRGGYGGYYIPQQTFSLYFGNQHYFRIGSPPTMYMGYPRFQYGGYSFLLLDPWPSDWNPNWYASDDLYIDYDDYDGGYYLYNRRDPQERLAVTIVV